MTEGGKSKYYSEFKRWLTDNYFTLYNVILAVLFAFTFVYFATCDDGLKDVMFTLFLAGALGGTLCNLRAIFKYYVKEGTLPRNFYVPFSVRPWMGGCAGLVTFFVLSFLNTALGGTEEPLGTFEGRVPYFGLALLAGFGSQEFLERLKEVAKTTFSEPRESDASDWCNKGNALYIQQEYLDAIKAYNRAIDIDPRYAEAWNNKGLALAKLGKYSEALLAYQQAIDVDPKRADTWFNKGDALYMQNIYDEACKEYAKALQINPKYAEAWNHKGEELKSHGKNEEAKCFFDMVKEYVDSPSKPAN